MERKEGRILGELGRNAHHPARRMFLFFGLQIFLLLVVGCARHTALVHRDSSFTLLHLTDTHLCHLDQYHPTLIEKRKHYGNGREPLLRALTAGARKAGADAIVITGDLIDFFEGTTAKGDVRAGQVERFVRTASRARVPLWLTLGNHDISTHVIGGKGESRPNQLRAQVARAAWIRQMDCFREGTGYFRDVRVGSRLWRLYFLDASYRAADEPTGNLWDRPQLDWLANELRQSPERTAILFFHIPLPVGDTNGDGDSFPVPKVWPLPDTYQKGIFKILNDHPSVVAAFVGHNHKNIIEDIPLPAGHSVAQVETGAFAADPKNWRTITLTENALIISKPGEPTPAKTIRVADRVGGPRISRP
ncbi:MAG: metallophosphoesterase [Candidatus Sumerlaeia bacterium]|nr:metallophosphoesterase [Candidatus Sumerlaeia bacterium]